MGGTGHSIGGGNVNKHRATGESVSGGGDLGVPSVGDTLSQTFTNFIKQYMDQMVRDRFMPKFETSPEHVDGAKLPVHSSEEQEKSPLMAKAPSMFMVEEGMKTPLKQTSQWNPSACGPIPSRETKIPLQGPNTEPSATRRFGMCTSSTNVCNQTNTAIPGYQSFGK